MRYANHTAYRLPFTGSAVMFGSSLQRNPPGEVALKGTVLARATVNMVPDTGKLTPPSVDLAHMTLLGELMGLGPPQHIPRCHASTMVPLGSIPNEGYSLWLVLRANSLGATTAAMGLQLAPPSVVNLTPTVL